MSLRCITISKTIHPQGLSAAYGRNQSEGRKGVARVGKVIVDPALYLRSNAVKSFVQRHASQIIGVLRRFDRWRVPGTLRWPAHEQGVRGFLSSTHVPLKDFQAYALKLTEALRGQATEPAAAAGRPVVYWESSAVSEAALALATAGREGVHEGLIAVFRCVEPCWTYKVGPNRASQKLPSRGGLGKCGPPYFDDSDPLPGFMHARWQTWFPFTTQVCLNGRRVLSALRSARQAGAAKLSQRAA